MLSLTYPGPVHVGERCQRSETPGTLMNVALSYLDLLPIYIR